MLMNNNASLNENNNVQISAGAAVFLLGTLNGYKYQVIDKNDKKYMVCKKGDYAGGMQPLESFINTINGSNPNMEEAKSYQLGVLRRNNPLLTNSSDFEVVCFYYANAQDSDKANFREMAESVGLGDMAYMIHGRANEGIKAFIR